MKKHYGASFFISGGFHRHFRQSHLFSMKRIIELGTLKSVPDIDDDGILRECRVPGGSLVQTIATSP